MYQTVKKKEINDKLKTHSLKNICKVCSKIVNISFKRWDKFTKLFRTKIKIVVTKAQTRYHFLIQTAFANFKEKGQKKTLGIKKKTVNIT